MWIRTCCTWRLAPAWPRGYTRFASPGQPRLHRLAWACLGCPSGAPRPRTTHPPRCDTPCPGRESILVLTYAVLSESRRHVCRADDTPGRHTGYSRRYRPCLPLPAPPRPASRHGQRTEPLLGKVSPLRPGGPRAQGGGVVGWLAPPGPRRSSPTGDTVTSRRDRLPALPAVSTSRWNF